MVSVLFYVPKGGLGIGWWLMAALVIAAGAGPFGAWLRATTARATAAKLVMALMVAGLVATTTYAVICPACEGCDPWWLEHFWICIPAQ